MGTHILIIGIGGRTGSMFANELNNTCKITGVGLDKEIDAIAAGNVIISAGNLPPKTLNIQTVRAEEYAHLAKNLVPDYIFAAVRNPVGEIIKNYYRPFLGQKKMPVLILAQNGLSVINDARKALLELADQAADNIGIIRVSLLNPVDQTIENGKINISYSLPIRLGFGGVGKTSADEIAQIFQQAGFKSRQFSAEKIAAMERSKLFLNLIGMAGAAAGLSVSDSFNNPKIFQREVLMLREYIAAVKKSKGSFTTLGGYPIGQLAVVLQNTPLSILTLLRGQFFKVYAKGHNNKPKDLGEIDYYNGEVVKLGHAVGVPTPINEEIVAAAKSKHFCIKKKFTGVKH